MTKRKDDTGTTVAEHLFVFKGIFGGITIRILCRKSNYKIPEILNTGAE